MTEHVPIIVITGNMGSGKTTILAETSDLLTAAGVLHAAIDLDTFGMGHVPETAWPDLPYRNLSCVWQNYAAAGASRLLIAEALESSRDLARIHDAVAGAQIVVCRLTATLETLRRRVAQREIGALRDTFVARVDELQLLIDAAQLEEFTLTTDDGSSVTDIARELLSRVHWLPQRAPAPELRDGYISHLMSCELVRCGPARAELGARIGPMGGACAGCVKMTRDAGHTKEIVDLYAIGFDPILRPRDDVTWTAHRSVWFSGSSAVQA